MERWDRDRYQAYIEELKTKIRMDRAGGRGGKSEKDGADQEPEENLRKKIVKWCREYGYPCLFFPGRAGKTKAVRIFVPIGWPDGVILQENGRVLFCELKSAKGKLRAEQVGQRRVFSWQGHKAHVLRSFKAFLAAFYGTER